MTEEHGRELERVRRARAEFEASQDEVERRKHDYFNAVSTLHEAGMPLREIATALGLSHQRVHQMVEEATGKKSSALRRRALKQGGVAVLVILLGITGFFTLRPDLSPLRSTDEPARVSDGRRTMPDIGVDRGGPGDHLDSRWCDGRMMEVMFSKALPDGIGVRFQQDCATAKIGRHVIDLEADIERQLRNMTITIRERA